MRKKILMQVRDTKTLVVDTIFPVTLIIFGMYLATVAVLKSGQSRAMSVAEIYPAPINFLYNKHSPSTTFDEKRLNNFVVNNICAFDTTSFKDGGSIDEWQVTTEPATGGSLVDKIKAFDESIFKLKTDGNGDFSAPYYGQVYMDNVVTNRNVANSGCAFGG